MKILDLAIGYKVKIMTDAKVEVELEIEKIEVKQNSREITPDTPENDWWGESVDWETYAVTFTNGHIKIYDRINDIKLI